MSADVFRVNAMPPPFRCAPAPSTGAASLPSNRRRAWRTLPGKTGQLPRTKSCGQPTHQFLELVEPVYLLNRKFPGRMRKPQYPPDLTLLQSPPARNAGAFTTCPVSKLGWVPMSSAAHGRLDHCEDRPAWLASAHQPCNGRCRLPGHVDGGIAPRGTEQMEAKPPDRRLADIDDLMPSIPELRTLVAGLPPGPPTSWAPVMQWSFRRGRRRAAAARAHHKHERHVQLQN